MLSTTTPAGDIDRSLADSQKTESHLDADLDLPQLPRRFTRSARVLLFVSPILLESASHLDVSRLECWRRRRGSKHSSRLVHLRDVGAGDRVFHAFACTRPAAAVARLLYDNPNHHSCGQLAGDLLAVDLNDSSCPLVRPARRGLAHLRDDCRLLCEHIAFYCPRECL